MRYVPSAAFFLFICWLIILRDLDQMNFLLRFGHHIPLGDKVAHFFLYGIQAFLLNIAFRFRRLRCFSVKFFLASLVVLGFAVLEEFSQLAFESRTFELADIVVDFLGIGVFTILSANFQLFIRWAKN